MLFLRILGAGRTILAAKANVMKKPELSQFFGCKITARLCQAEAHLYNLLLNQKKHLNLYDRK
jgi:hypothetical protein